MERKKRGILVLLGVFILVLCTFVSAETGCYMFPKTGEDLYCHDLDRELVAEDCGSYDECNLREHFIPSSCSDFEDCRQILCSVDCQLHSLGWCKQFGLDAAFRRGGFVGDDAEDLMGREANETNKLCVRRCCKALPYCSRGFVTAWECLLGTKRAGFDTYEEAFPEECEDPTAWCGIELAPGNLSGYVLVNGNAVSPSSVTLDDGRTAVITNNKYLFENLAPRSYVVSVSTANYPAQNKEIFVSSGREAQYNFTLQEAGGMTFKGKVCRDETCQGPISSATISWQEAGRTRTFIADNQGEYEIAGLPEGDYLFTASKREFVSSSFQASFTEEITEIEHNFILAPATRQGIEGIVSVQGVPTLGVILFVNGVRREFSRMEGRYSIELAPGVYNVTASYQETFGFGPEEVVVTPAVMTPFNLELTEIEVECGPGTFKNVETFSASPILGQSRIRLEWEKPCKEVISYEIRKYLGEELIDVIPAAPYETFREDGEVDWGKSYRYEIKAEYAGNQFSPSSTPVGVYVGDEICEDRFNDLGASQTFCLSDNTETDIAEHKLIWSCDSNNRLQQYQECFQHEIGEWFCAGVGEGMADCKNGGNCGLRTQDSAPFGLYYTRESCYGSMTPEEETENFCYFDSTESVVDKCSSCANVKNCFAYTSQEACNINNCLTSVCNWINVSSNVLLIDYSPFLPVNYTNPLFTSYDTGAGYCAPEEYEMDDKCSLCGPTGDSTLFENYYCTAEVCSNLGRCFSEDDLTECNQCGFTPKYQKANCYEYQTELECTDYGTGLTITGGEIEFSDDRCGWERCAWLAGENNTGRCVKDGDDDKEGDCEQFPYYQQPECVVDIEGPLTTVTEGTTLISTAYPNFTFSSIDNHFLGTLYYCLVGADVNAQDYCSEEIFAESKKNYTYGKADSLTVNLLDSLNEEVDKETYRLKFYSKDYFLNQEEMKETFVFIDNVLPEFELQSSHITTADRTDLTVLIPWESEPMSCVFELIPKLPRGDTLRARVNSDITGKQVVFENLAGIYYNLTVTCTDVNGNVNSKSEWYTFDLEQGIDVIYPPVGSALSTTTLEFLVGTDVGSICELRTVVDDQRVADFVPDEEWKKHRTEPLSGFFEGEYLDTYKVVCRELLNQADEATDYFSFSVDFTAPQTQIILQESGPQRRPTQYGWEEFFVSSAFVSFKCSAEGFNCSSTYYCFGERCVNPNYQLYSPGELVEVTESTRICYFSVDAGENTAYPVCGDIIISGFGITLTSPEPHYFQDEVWGISSHPQFAWSFFSKVPTQRCKFDFVPHFNYDEVPQYRIMEGIDNHYSFNPFPGEIIASYPAKGDVKPVYIVCENLVGELGPEQKLNLEYDPSAPNILEAYAEPDEIVERTKTILNVVTDDKTLCRYSDNSEKAGSFEYATMQFAFPGAVEKILGRQHSSIFNINFVGASKQFVFNTQCKNGAGGLSEVREIPFTVDYSVLGNIMSLSPEGLIPSREVLLEVTTNKDASCFYKGEDENIELNPFDGSGGRYHSKTLSGLTDGEHIYPVQCSFGDHKVNGEIKFTIDFIGPKITSIEDGNFTCGLDEINVFVYTDDEKVDSYYYELFNKDPTTKSKNLSISSKVIIASGTIRDDQPFRLQGLNLTAGKYAVRVKANDSAGNLGDFMESDGVLLVPANDSGCVNDTSPPRVSVVTNETCTGVTAELYCNDETTCRNLFYGKQSTATLCTTNSSYTGKKIAFEQSGWLCYYAEDNRENNLSGSWEIKFHDVDGDGIADSCDLCPETEAGKIADETGCAIGEVPKDVRGKDTDGDTLPDYWEILHNSSSCKFEPDIFDTDGDGIGDSENDYDNDGYDNYEEYLSGTDPCLAADPPITPPHFDPIWDPILNESRGKGDDHGNDSWRNPVEPPSPFEDAPANTLAWILLLIGIFMVFGGTGYLFYYYYYSPAAQQAARQTRSTGGIVSPVKAEQQQVVRPEDKMLLQQRKARREKTKASRREVLFSEFNKDSEGIPHVDEALSKKTPHLPRLQELAQNYTKHKEEIKPGLRKEEKGIFARLENLTKQSKGNDIKSVVSKDEAKDIFSKLRDLSKKRKKGNINTKSS